MNGIVEITLGLLIIGLLYFVFKDLKQNKKDMILLYFVLLIMIIAYSAISSIYALNALSLQYVLFGLIIILAIFFIVKIIKNQDGIVQKSVEMLNKHEESSQNETTVIDNIQTNVNQPHENKLEYSDLYSIFPKPFLRSFYVKFYKENLIDQNLTYENFRDEIRNKMLRLNINGPTLYFLHAQFKLNNKRVIPLIKFVTYFKDVKGYDFNYDTVKNGKAQSNPLYKEMILSIFDFDSVDKG